MRTRRLVVKTLALAATAAAVPGGMATRLGAAPESPPPAPPPAPGPDDSPAAAPAPWELLSPLGPGDPVALGWRLETLSEVRDGAAVLVLSHDDGSRARIHLCRNEGRPHGPAHTRTVDLLVMNGGRGDRPTDESLGRVVLGLAGVITANEDRSGGHGEAVARMLTHDERIRRYGAIASEALA